MGLNQTITRHQNQVLDNIANIPMKTTWTDEGEVSEIKHKMNLTKKELQKNPQHLALQKIRDNFQDQDDIVMTHIEQKIIILQE